MTLREAFLSACPSGAAEDPDLQDLALKVLERCQAAILDAPTFEQAPVVQVQGLAHDTHTRVYTLSMPALTRKP